MPNYMGSKSAKCSLKKFIIEPASYKGGIKVSIQRVIKLESIAVGRVNNIPCHDADARAPAAVLTSRHTQ